MSPAPRPGDTIGWVFEDDDQTLNRSHAPGYQHWGTAIQVDEDGIVWAEHRFTGWRYVVFHREITAVIRKRQDTQ